jgi:glutaredoxin-related protein
LKDVAADERFKDEMKAASGKATVPQVFVDGKYKGVSLN